MNSIKWTQKARKQLRRIDKKVIENVLSAVDELAHWPDCKNVKNLVGRNDFRLRVGRYRVLFTVQNGEPVIIRIEEVKKRDERTY